MEYNIIPEPILTHHKIGENAILSKTLQNLLFQFNSYTSNLTDSSGRSLPAGVLKSFSAMLPLPHPQCKVWLLNWAQSSCRCKPIGSCMIDLGTNICWRFLTFNLSYLLFFLQFFSWNRKWTVNVIRKRKALHCVLP